MYGGTSGMLTMLDRGRMRAIAERTFRVKGGLSRKHACHSEDAEDKQTD